MCACDLKCISYCAFFVCMVAFLRFIHIAYYNHTPLETMSGTIQVPNYILFLCANLRIKMSYQQNGHY
ncbi:hypothetical protein ASPTUDRAFT_420644 [Aspergillus tubingensis CBS 134.48]|uniref:Uncharacterized protein n=1 Tax=Aspergillus tubingensis (strain CBS 134.48) TaxID=767770 RepID=A0A1L9NEK2_ASPTC|nr:hypothetical protein ASPTUDRAFT_420644 [Aspergillus tubingensis CBS 134.48]